MPTESGYNNQKKLGTSQFKTIQELGSGVYGAPVASKSLFDVSAAQALVSISPVMVDGQIKAYDLELTAHGVTNNNGIVKFTSGVLTGWEIPVESVIDVDTLRVLAVFPVLPTAGDFAKPMGWVTPKADSDGNLNFSPGPTQFVQDGLSVQVEEDTANAANNRGLPILPMFYKDGNMVSVNVDTATPANNRLFPVELSSLAGPITVNAGDLSVSIVATNDSVAIGDASTGLTANVTTNGTSGTEELHVRDDDANINLGLAIGELQDIEADVEAMSAKLPATLGTKTAAASLSVTLASDNAALPLPTGASTLAEQQTQTGHLAAIETAVELIDNAVNVDANPAGTSGLMVGGVDGSGDFQRVAVNTAGELSVTFGSAGFATETTLSALNNKHTADFGTSSGAIRTAAQLGNASGAADFNAGADSAQTLRVSANLKRAGNELSYNSGAVDANTLRFIPASDSNLAKEAQLPATLGQKTGANSLAVVMASDYIPPAPAVPTALTVKQAALSVGTSAVRLTSDAAAPSATRRKMQFIIEPGGATNFFMGSSSVTSSGATRGIRVYPGTLYTYDNDAGDYYIISDTASQTVLVTEQE